MWATCLKCNTNKVKSRYRLCPSCEATFLKDRGYNIGDTVYTLLKYNENKKQKYKIISATITQVCRYYPIGEHLWRIVLSEELGYITLKQTANNRTIERNLNDVYKTTDECYEHNKDKLQKSILKQAQLKVQEEMDNNLINDIESYYNSSLVEDKIKEALEEYKQAQISANELLEADKARVLSKIKQVAEQQQIDDIMIIGQQDLIYNQIKQFLESSLAKQFNITGLVVKKEGRYVNLEWKFGEE